MNKRIKLIWDFRGPDARATAEHHAKHLSEFAVLEALEEKITGHRQFSDMHSIAFMVVEERQMIKVRDALAPHRGEVYESP
ncbi:MAG: hypothetical protein KJN76_07405 [Eudoraea sp.]|nr:hypothetical protein [Eudoraea sp.]